ncbi:hypothetical protein Cgig2_027766 [Carnegiea gigantea]|uniref:Uncharacterized protein n=1 Tax=Carnegiea gigantea TaxID=171969 RepID=A0A9Q1GIJ9_9CARY|nr:hypothetical protein Cgig2_027766 [Carnegiea gigantea]
MEAGVELGVFATGGYLITEGDWEGGGWIEGYGSRCCELVQMDGDGAVMRGCGGELDNGGPGKITYAGGSMKCIMLKEGLEIEEVRRVVTEITGNNLTVQKFTTRVVMEGERDADVRMFLKENDEHGYLYEGDSDRSKRCAQRASASHEGRMRSCDHGIGCGRSGRDRDDMVE